MEVLSQDEIEQLLRALNAGDTEPEDFRPSADSRKISIYDFARPSRLLNIHKEKLTEVFNSFSHNLANNLIEKLSLPVQIKVASADELTYDELICSIPNSTTLVTVSMPPLKGNMLFELTDEITYAIIYRIRQKNGITKKIKSLQELYDYANPIIEKTIVDILGLLKKAWAEIIALQPELVKIVTDPQSVRLISPSDMIVVVTMNIKIEEIESIINFGMPYAVFKQVRDKLAG